MNFDLTPSGAVPTSKRGSVSC